MLTTKDAIEQRRSIRNFKPEPVPEEYINALLDAARLAPSGCNSQPWRFKIARNDNIKMKLAEAAYGQSFIARAPVVLVCCADIKGYLEGSVSGAQDLGRIRAVEERIVEIVIDRINQVRTMSFEEIGLKIALNTAIAIEHIVLRAQDFGLGTCWIRLFDEKMIKELFGWNENIYIVALLPIGYPAESPSPRKRLKLEEILLN